MARSSWSEVRVDSLPLLALFFLSLGHHHRLLSGWLQKEMKTNAKSTSLKLKKRWFVLTHNSLDYYKSSERNSSKMGTLVLNSLCSVIQPDERVHRETGERNEAKRQNELALIEDYSYHTTTCADFMVTLISSC